MSEDFFDPETKQELHHRMYFECTMPPEYKWVMRCSGLQFYRLEGEQPNWVHRKMQSIFFGFKWERIK